MFFSFSRELVLEYLIRLEFRNNKYVVVEGQVSEHIPAQPEFRKPGSFTVDGVEFDFSYFGYTIGIGYSP
ncbi:MAG: hypothetical protein HRU38_03520 [Saccharospirillaceae bacterium]|nr:hypothetical protein [Pseudomonadales bacterium]NRB77732.1 hypothetical protein [Saccharospirillaceae bacterium]